MRLNLALRDPGGPEAIVVGKGKQGPPGQRKFQIAGSSWSDNHELLSIAPCVCRECPSEL
jgi:hypothetical protein